MSIVKLKNVIVLLILLSLKITLIYGKCKDPTGTRTECLSKTLGNTDTWHVCDYCLCQEMGGSCDDETFQDILECQIKANVADHELLCRLSLQEPWLIGFSIFSFIFGSMISFFVYLYYKTADWSTVWESKTYLYFKNGTCCIDFFKCAPLLYILTFQPCFDIYEMCRKGSKYKYCSSKYWYEIYQCIGNIRILPEWCQYFNPCLQKPMFKQGGYGNTGGGGYNPYATGAGSPGGSIGMIDRAGRSPGSPGRRV